MEKEILLLKKLNAAYMAALEWDYCPDSSKAKNVIELFETGISEEDLKSTLDENAGRRPDEIAGEISEIIKFLKL